GIVCFLFFFRRYAPTGFFPYATHAGSLAIAIRTRGQPAADAERFRPEIFPPRTRGNYNRGRERERERVSDSVTTGDTAVGGHRFTKKKTTAYPSLFRTHFFRYLHQNRSLPTNTR
ncbi:Hypothetical protein CINCED_3A015212, partial [Cinara cedri]